MATTSHESSQPAAPCFSVCICTRDRPEDLARALRSVEASTYPAHQIIVSDDSKEPHTRAMVTSEFPQVVFLEGPRRGLGANRNNALDAVTGTHVAFIDDDATLSADFLARTAQSLQNGGQHPEKLIITGYELNHGTRIFANAVTFLGFQSRPYKAGDYHNTVVINSAVFPAWLFKVIRFDEHLIYGYDEVDILMRATLQGKCAVRTLPEVFNCHYPSMVNREYYASFVEASRIYVTHKRYRWFERNRTKAAVFLTLAVAHNLLHNLRAHGPKGLSRSMRTVSLARGYIRRYTPEGLALQNENNCTCTHVPSNLGSRPVP
ncbi:glycosyl transferase [Caballeronia sordidicola]|uniref:Glycosyl transferase n=1 Tax=Caballeronia sordidicola TaxID=196367 RepID=A0A158GMZ5_CABSO|nr:glycosyltransferase family A protein [Caballeronia sordidicola]SAL33486.1 glycosyl transferase [Caballeronia sordidicola]